jgi:TctA family transporter
MGTESFAVLEFITLAVLYPLLTGPVAALVYLRILRQNHRTALVWFWLCLLIANSLGFVYLAVITGEGLLEPGFFSCLFTPVFSLASGLVIRLGRSRMNQELSDQPYMKSRWLRGVIFIPLLQILTVGVFTLLAPYLCEIGLRSC